MAIAPSDAYRCRLRMMPPRYHCSRKSGIQLDSNAPDTLVRKKINSHMPLISTIQQKENGQ